MKTKKIEAKEGDKKEWSGKWEKVAKVLRKFFFPPRRRRRRKRRRRTKTQQKRDIPQWAEIDIRLFIFRHCKAHFTDKS